MDITVFYILRKIAAIDMSVLSKINAREKAPG